VTRLLYVKPGSAPLYFAAGCYLAVVAAVFVVEDPTVAASFLFIVPIAIFAIAASVEAGLAAAVIALAAVAAHWEMDDVSVHPLAYLTRGVAFAAVPLLILWTRESRRDVPGEARCSARRSAELTARESEVLHLIALGHTNPEIAGQLVISVRTVEGHRARLQRKLGRSGRAELVSYALEHGLISST
jgi:DNA-binding NarL/FixJ family response regulator